MKKLAQSKWFSVLYGGLLLVVGALTLVFAILDPSKVDTAISIALAVSLFIIGIVHIATALIAHTNEFFQMSLLSGSIAIAFGVVFCIDRGLIGQFITYLLGVFFLSLGLIAIIKFILFIVYKQNLAWIIMYGVMALVAVAAGILVLCFRDESKQVLYGIIGSTIILSGLLEIVLAVKAMSDAKKNGNQKDETINVEAQPVEQSQPEAQLEAEEKAEPEAEEKAVE